MLNLVRLIEIREDDLNAKRRKKQILLSETLINSDNVCFLRDDTGYNEYLKGFKLWPEGLDKRSVFTRIYFGGLNNYIRIVGDFNTIAKKFGI